MEPTEKVVVDGEELSIDDIKNLRETSKNTLRDYHAKTEALAREREALQAEKDKVAEEERKILAAQGALANDIVFYKTNPVENWSKRVPEIDKVLGTSTVVEEGESKLSREQDERIKKLEAETAKLRQETILEKVKSARELIDELSSKEFKGADVEACKDKLYVILDSKGAIPSKEEIRELVKTSFQKEEKKKADFLKAESEKLREKMGAGGEDKKGIVPSLKGGTEAQDSKPKLPSLDDHESIRKVGQDFFDRRRAGRKS